MPDLGATELDRMLHESRKMLDVVRSAPTREAEDEAVGVGEMADGRIRALARARD
jgi:hypothetical protein